MEAGFLSLQETSRVLRFMLLITVLAGLAACGGSGGPAKTTSSSSGSGGNSNPPASATPISVVGGQTASGADIVVPAAAVTPQENAQDLGVNAACNGGSAFNVGDVIHRGASQQILIFGAGLNANMKATVNGPADIQLSVVSAVKATDGTPGVCLNATVSSNAALGARTVVLQGSNGDVTTFTGGLEVQP